MRISDWSSDVCSSDLDLQDAAVVDEVDDVRGEIGAEDAGPPARPPAGRPVAARPRTVAIAERLNRQFARADANPARHAPRHLEMMRSAGQLSSRPGDGMRSEERRVGKECQYV